MTIGEKIRAHRKERKMTQRELAEKSNLANSTIQQYEAEQYVPKFEQLSRIAEALNMSLIDFLPDTGEDFGKRLFDLRGHDEVASIHTDYESYQLMSEIAGDFLDLNMDGKKEAAKRVNELTQIKMYQADHFGQNVRLDDLVRKTQLRPDEPKPKEE